MHVLHLYSNEVMQIETLLSVLSKSHKTWISMKNEIEEEK